jgi:hypothetical protein
MLPFPPCPPSGPSLFKGKIKAVMERRVPSGSESSRSFVRIDSCGRQLSRGPGESFFEAMTTYRSTFSEFDGQEWKVLPLPKTPSDSVSGRCTGGPKDSPLPLLFLVADALRSQGRTIQYSRVGAHVEGILRDRRPADGHENDKSWRMQRLLMMLQRGISPPTPPELLPLSSHEQEF